MELLETKSPDFQKKFQKLLQRGKMDIEGVEKIVRDILKDVQTRGDRAVMEQIAKFDQWTPTTPKELEITPEEMEAGYYCLEPQLREALQIAKERIENYHRKQLPKSWLTFEENGTILGQKVTPVDRAGVYVPGGKAFYPSSLLMNVIPAQVAGVKEIIVTTPTIGNRPHPLLLGALYLLGSPKTFKVGGAGAIGALAYGTGTIPKVDVISGPGNIFVATAKKLVYGEVNIDMIAGPSEIGIIADSSARPDYLAIDLLSQAEHDEMASSILITPDGELARRTIEEIYKILPTLEREEIARKSIENRGVVIVTQNLEEAIDLMNQIAPEHLEVMTSNPFQLLPKIRHAGAIFLGENTPEPIGDYLAGPNHTLPTGGTAKFYSPLSPEVFLKKSSIISFSSDAISQLGEACALLAQAEELTAHQRAVLTRLKENKREG
ncbi:MAG: histidinol dehydrogenase [Epsilonproteobacteria bacterium]|nr:histidinol dehydrogenase [Campylobacterota bacterium]NPA88632.1 histidinol dehydrogenase [Campylobacterota bacterium]